MGELTEQELRLDPEYAQAEAEYIAARNVAQAASDENGQLRAELQWTNRRHDLTRRITTQRETATQRTALLAEVKEKYPFIPELLYDAIADPDQLRKVVEELAVKFEGAQQTADWGPAGTGAGAQGTGRRQQAEARKALYDKANHGDPQAIREVQKTVWGEAVAQSPLLTRNIRRPAGSTR